MERDYYKDIRKLEAGVRAGAPDQLIILKCIVESGIY